MRNALFALPSRFESELVIGGVLATDLHSFNTSLGATIEEQVVGSLNKLRSVWDANNKYALYSFERQPQTFPDVVLKASAPDVEPDILMGIELKGWYVLAKEREPSFRYVVTPQVCAEADFLVVVPWALSKVISGSPRVFEPFVVGARYAAEYRNWWWQHQRDTKQDSSISISDATAHYPAKSDRISDRPVKDGGGNFGRMARTGMLDDYKQEVFADRLAGIPLSAWQQFLQIFAERATDEEVEKSVSRLANTLADTGTADDRKQLRDALRNMADAIRE